MNFNVNAGETKTVTFDGVCTGKYLVVKSWNLIKLALCRVKVYGTCSSKNMIVLRDGPFDIQGGLGFFLATSYFFLCFCTTCYFFQKQTATSFLFF